MAYTPIDKSSDYFNTILWTGNGGSQTISGYGFQPDFLWTKVRDAADSHQLRDAVRTINKPVRSNSTVAEYTVTSAGAFNADGFTTVGNDGDEFNGNSKSYVSWGWKANGSGASNEDGTINTTKTSANTTSGFSISTYTGTGSAATFGHGLGVAPDAVIVKNLGAAEDWNVWIRSQTPKIGLLNDGAVFYSPGAAGINGPTITSSVIGLGTSATANGSSATYVAYCFTSIKGFSKFGSYVGNGNADGPFIFTGMKPAFTLIKRAAGGTESWYINDNKRLGYNPNNYYLLPNDAAAEGSSATLKINLLSNGFKIRNTDTSYNTSGSTYVYLSFAENPFVTSTGIPTLAS